MTLLLRRQRVQDRIEGREPGIWADDDYAVVDDTVIGRIYKEMIHGREKWLWFLQSTGLGPGRLVPPPSQGMADTLEEAKEALAKRYEEAKRGK